MSSQQGPIILRFTTRSSNAEVLVPKTWLKVAPLQLAGSSGSGHQLSSIRCEKLTIKAINNFHPLALSFLDIVLLESVFTLHKLGRPLFHARLLSNLVEVLVHVGSGHFEIRFALPSYRYQPYAMWSITDTYRSVLVLA